MFNLELFDEKALRLIHQHASLKKANGTAQFVSDIRWPGTLEGVIVRAPVPRCRIISLDTAQARSMPGVQAVVTADDINGKKRIGKTVEDQAFLCKEETYGVYDAIALVAADTLEQAQAAARAIKLKYEELPAVYDLDEARQPGAILARPDINPESNILSEYHYSTGDAAAAIAGAAVRVEQDFTVVPIEHCYLENDCAAARFLEDGSLEVYVGCHDVIGEKEILTSALKMPEEKVRVIQPFMGGSFGGKDDGLICVYAALLARSSGKPVRLWIDRADEMVFHTKRHGQQIHICMGFDREGNVLGADYNIASDTGSSAHHGANISKFVSVNVCGPYTIPAVNVNSYVYYSNNMALGAMRSWDMTGITFANETLLNMAAEQLGMDPMALRIRNAVTDGDRTLSGSIIPSNARYRQCLKIISELPLLPKPDLGQRFAYGVGYAGGSQGSNLHFGYRDESTVRLRVGDEGNLYIEVAASDLGQGMETTLDLIVSCALHRYPIEKIHYCRPDTDYPAGGPTGASRQTTITGNATYLAATKLLGRIEELGGPAAIDNIEDWLIHNGKGLQVEATFMGPLTTNPDENGRGFPVNQYGYGVQRAEVAVDVDTGLVKVLKISAVCDCGTVLNRIGAEGQIQGAIGQGLGMALMEEFRQKDGRPLQHGFSDYLFPTAADTPPIDVHFVDLPVDFGYLHVKGMAELFTTFTAPAVIAAIHDAVGVWINQLPATPERMLMAMAAKEAR